MSCVFFFENLLVRGGVLNEIHELRYHDVWWEGTEQWLVKGWSTSHYFCNKGIWMNMKSLHVFFCNLKGYANLLWFPFHTGLFNPSLDVGNFSHRSEVAKWWMKSQHLGNPKSRRHLKVMEFFWTKQLLTNPNRHWPTNRMAFYSSRFRNIPSYIRSESGWWSPLPSSVANTKGPW